MKHAVRIGADPLTVQVMELQPCVAAVWEGSGPDSTRETAAAAMADLVARAAERVILDFSRLSAVSEPIAQVLARGVTECQRLGREVCLVRCGEELFRRLQRAGAAGVVTHAPSLLAATDGLMGDPANMVEMHLRSMPELLYRVRRVASVLAAQAGFCQKGESLLQTAVTEATANAILHGSPEGPRNHVRVSFHLDDGSLIVDVADQGQGFDPGRVPEPSLTELTEHGFGLHMIRQSVDQVEFFRGEQGMLVRLTKFLDRGRREWAQ